MDQLRVILIVLGIVLVAGIWLVDRIRRRKAKWPPQGWDEIDAYNEDAVSEEESFSSQEPEHNPDEWVGKAFSAQRHDVLDDAQLEGLKGLASTDSAVSPDEVSLNNSDADVAPASRVAPAEKQDAPAEEVIVLTLLAGEGRKFRGPLLLKAMQDCGFVHGDMEIFHYTPEGHSYPLFSAANVLEPGRFILSEMAQLETPGIALFMRLPGVLAGNEALQQLLHKARQLGAQLNASLCDGQRQPLNDAALAQLEKKAQQFPAAR